MGTIVIWAAYGLGTLLFVAATMLAVYGFLQFVPGAYGNSLRRTLFQLCHPWLKAVESFADIRLGGKDCTAFLVAVLLIVICRYGLPWLVLLGYSLRG